MNERYQPCCAHAKSRHFYAAASMAGPEEYECRDCEGAAAHHVFSEGERWAE